MEAYIQGNKDVEDWAAKLPGRTRKAISFTVRDELAIIQTEHKLKTTKRSAVSTARAVAGKWTHRSGDLAKSFHTDWKPGSFKGAYGSSLPRAKTIEEGGTIRPKGKYLAIPTEHAPKKVWPRHVPGLVFLQSLKGQPLLVKPTGGNTFLVMYILRRQVTLPPRPSLDKAVKNTAAAREKRTLKTLEGLAGDK